MVDAGGMDPHQFFGIIAAVLIANVATASFIYGWVRVTRTDSMDLKSGSALLIAGGIAMISGYLAA